MPYQPFVEALRHFIHHSAADQQMSCLGRYPGELVRLAPELADRLPGIPLPLSSDPETERYRLFDAVAGWLAGASRDHPVLDNCCRPQRVGQGRGRAVDGPAARVTGLGSGTSLADKVSIAMSRDTVHRCLGTSFTWR